MYVKATKTPSQGKLKRKTNNGYGTAPGYLVNHFKGFNPHYFTCVCFLFNVIIFVLCVRSIIAILITLICFK